jgi:citrate synthase
LIDGGSIDAGSIDGGSTPASAGLQRAPELRVSAGIAHLGRQIIVHGLDLHHDCPGMSFVHYLLFCVTGRWFDERRARVFEQLWVASAYPDARIWCNRIAGYMGSARVDPGFSMSAALAASNSQAYGFRAVSRAYEVVSEVPEELGEREAWLSRQLEARRVLYGYGRPLHDLDERIPAALQALVDAGMRAGPALGRAFWLHRALGERKGKSMNIAAVWAAIAIDFGVARHEFDGFMLLMFAPGYAAVHADQSRRAPMSFLFGHQTRPRAPDASPAGAPPSEG